MVYVARTMRPTFKALGMSRQIMGVDGQRLGAVLPGKGIYIDVDLKSLGITKQIPGVYERSRFRRLFERVHHDQRGAITTYDGIINGRANGKGEDIVIAKSSITTAIGFWYDTFRAGGNPAAGTYNVTTAPTDTLTDRATTGAMSSYLTNPTNPDKKYLIAMGWGATSAHNFAILGDMHVQSGMYRTSVTTAETVAVPKTIVRQYGPGTLGQGDEIVAVVTTARTTPTTSTLTITYLDENAASSTTAPAMLANADPVDRCLALPNQGSPFADLASGDLGVRQVSQAQKAATADAAGACNLQIFTPLTFVPGVAANIYIERDAPMNIDGLTELAASSFVIGCLRVLVFANATTLGTMTVFLRTVAG